MDLDEAYVIEIMAIGVQKWEALQNTAVVHGVLLKWPLSDY